MANYNSTLSHPVGHIFAPHQSQVAQDKEPPLPQDSSARRRKFIYEVIKYVTLFLLIVSALCCFHWANPSWLFFPSSIQPDFWLHVLWQHTAFHWLVFTHSSIRSYSPLGTGAGALWPPEPRCRIAPQKSASSKWCRWGEGDARWGKWGGPIDQPPFLATGTQNQAGPDCHDTRWGIWGGPL